ncbi:hypothetical protein KBD20_04665 [Candidatus Saccharibacteria bacterium]|nr:hypothetical protein [Candidatus Saccharibacteria bacterium]
MATWEQLQFNQPTSAGHVLHREQLAATDMEDEREAAIDSDTILLTTCPEVRRTRLAISYFLHRGLGDTSEDVLRTIETRGRD